MSLRSRGLGMALGALMATTTGQAWADEPLTYAAPAGCPSRDEVLPRIAAHRAPGDHARIDIERSAEGSYHGTLVLTGGDGKERARRSVDARTCGAVIEAMALVAALAPHEAPSEEPPAEPGAPPPPEAAVTPPNAPATPPTDTSTTTSDDTLAPRGPSTVDTSAQVKVTRARATRFLLGVTPFSGTSFGADRLMIGLGVFAEADSASELFDVGVLQPSARLSIGGTLPTRSGDRTLDWGSCSDCGPQVHLITLAVDLCPIGAGHHERLGFAVCVHNEIGTIVARAGNRTESDTRLWGAIGPIARGRFVITPPRAGITEPGALFVDVTGGGIAPVRRDAFYFYDIGSAFLTPSFLYTFGIALGAVVQ
ncbi:MAG: hypothetical protein JST00_37630 [Deltaproteobacteria bacterium]|nr:hypothetical protein [Deltaproteobacteria bacterium]